MFGLALLLLVTAGGLQFSAILHRVYSSSEFLTVFDLPAHVMGYSYWANTASKHHRQNYTTRSHPGQPLEVMRQVMYEATTNICRTVNAFFVSLMCCPVIELDIPAWPKAKDLQHEQQVDPCNLAPACLPALQIWVA